MADARVAQGTRIFIESARGSAQALSGITKASPPVFTYSGTDPANGSYMIVKDMTGMTEFQDAIVKVANVDGVANTFEAKDQDSGDFGTFSAGNIFPVTFGTEITFATGYNTTGGEAQYTNYMLLWDRQERRKYTHNAASGIDIPCLFDPTDANWRYLYNLGRTGQTMAVKFLYSDGVEMVAFGDFGGGGLPSASDSRSVQTVTFSINPSTKPWFILP
jgi:hypothetical protein